MPIVLGAQKSEAGRSLELKTFRSAWEVYWDSTSNNKKHSKAYVKYLLWEQSSYPHPLGHCELVCSLTVPNHFPFYTDGKKNKVLLKSQFVNILFFAFWVTYPSVSNVLILCQNQGNKWVPLSEVQSRLFVWSLQLSLASEVLCSDSTVKSNAYSLYFSHLGIKNRQTQLYVGKSF